MERLLVETRMDTTELIFDSYKEVFKARKQNGLERKDIVGVYKLTNAVKTFGLIVNFAQIDVT